MNTRNLLSIAALLLGESLIIAGFFLWKGGCPNNIFALNLIVTSLIYGLFFVDILVPWIDWNDKAQKQVGTLGIRWFITWTYAPMAILTMLLCNLYFDTVFKVQLIIHGILLFLLILGFVGVLHSSDKVHEIYQTEKEQKQGLCEMKKAVTKLKDSIIGHSSLPEDITTKINKLEEELRYLSPCNSPDAFSLETEFVEIIGTVTISIPNYLMNQEKINAALRKAEHILKNRRSIYST